MECRRARAMRQGLPAWDEAGGGSTRAGGTSIDASLEPTWRADAAALALMD